MYLHTSADIRATAVYTKMPSRVGVARLSQAIVEGR